VTAAVCISGVFELEPLVSTTINAALGLSPAAARAASPRLWAPPPPGRELLAVVGEQEGQEFHRQSRELVATWSAAGTAACGWEAPGANHFTVIEQLTDPAAALHSAVRERAAALHARRSA
jgi:arylformamidase